MISRSLHSRAVTKHTHSLEKALLETMEQFCHRSDELWMRNVTSPSMGTLTILFFVLRGNRREKERHEPALTARSRSGLSYSEADVYFFIQLVPFTLLSASGASWRAFLKF